MGGAHGRDRNLSAIIISAPDALGLAAES